MQREAQQELADSEQSGSGSQARQRRKESLDLPELADPNDNATAAAGSSSPARNGSVSHNGVSYQESIA